MTLAAAGRGYHRRYAKGVYGWMLQSGRARPRLTDLLTGLSGTLTFAGDGALPRGQAIVFSFSGGSPGS